MAFQFPRNTNPDRLPHHIIDYGILCAVADEMAEINLNKVGSITIEQIQIVLLALEVTGMVVSARELEAIHKIVIELQRSISITLDLLEKQDGNR